MPDDAPVNEATAPLPGIDGGASKDRVAHHAVQAHFQRVLNKLAADATGSANRLARAALVAEPPSIDKGEVTDKGSINQRAVLKHRDALVQALHADTAPFIIKPSREAAA